MRNSEIYLEAEGIVTHKHIVKLIHVALVDLWYEGLSVNWVQFFSDRFLPLEDLLTELYKRRKIFYFVIIFYFILKHSDTRGFHDITNFNVL